MILFKKPIVCKMMADNHVELILNGVIVQDRPIDYWTGEPRKGLYISLENFLEVLEEMKAAQTVTLRINSPGGDANVGVAMYSHLKSLSPKITGIVDGIAASAATLLLAAADDVQVHAGSRLMYHKARLGIFDWCTEDNLMQALGQIQNTNKSAAEIYHLQTGIPVEEISALMEAETWFTGKEAIEKGFANTLLYEKEPKIELSSDKKSVIVNGIAHNAAFLGSLTEKIMAKKGFLSSLLQVEPAVAIQQNAVLPVDIDETLPTTNLTGGQKKMIRTLDELRSEYPTLCAELETVATAQGALQERQRLQGIDEIAMAIGNAEMVSAAKYGEMTLNAGALAIAVLGKEKTAATDFIEKLEKDSVQVPAAPNAGAGLSAEEQMMEQAKSIAQHANKME